jgi:hypothetical protein
MAMVHAALRAGHARRTEVVRPSRTLDKSHEPCAETPPVIERCAGHSPARLNPVTAAPRQWRVAWSCHVARRCPRAALPGLPQRESAERLGLTRGKIESAVRSIRLKMSDWRRGQP